MNYMRRTNFARGLRNDLRQMVYRRKCKTIDEAVKAEADEEAVEASHRGAEVSSCYEGEGSPALATTGLVERIVAALELRKKEKMKNESATPGEEEAEDFKFTETNTEKEDGNQLMMNTKRMKNKEGDTQKMAGRAQKNTPPLLFSERQIQASRVGTSASKKSRRK